MFLWFFVGNTKKANLDRLHEGEPNDFKIVNSYEPSRKDSLAKNYFYYPTRQLSESSPSRKRRESLSRRVYCHLTNELFFIDFKNRPDRQNLLKKFR